MQCHYIKRHQKMTYKHLQNEDTFGLLAPFTNGGNAYLYESKKENVMII